MDLAGWEAFIHAVFAIAITLLVLDVPVPRSETTPDTAALVRALLDGGPRYAAYLFAFLYVGAYWIATYRSLRMLRGVDEWCLVIGLIYLMFIALVPFVAALLAEYLGADGGRSQVALVVFAAWQLILATVAYLGFRYWRHARLLKDEVEAEAATRTWERTLLASVAIWLIVPLASIVIGSAALLMPGILFAVSLWNASTRRSRPART